MSTGLQIAKYRNQVMRFMTLTSSNQSPKSINDSFDNLKKRILRANRQDDGFTGFKFNKYFKLYTDEGNGVLHIVFWGGNFIPQDWLSKTWEEIHQAPIVHIERVYSDRQTVAGLVAYLLQNYFTKQPILRMSYGWCWAWLGFAKAWQKVKETYRNLKHTSTQPLGTKIEVLGYFKRTRRDHYIRAWLTILHNPPPSTRQKKLMFYI